MKKGITRRKLIGRGATAAAGFAVFGLDPLEAAAQRRRGIHCLAPVDQFKAANAYGGSTFAAFSADGATLALTTPGGIRVRPRKGGAGGIVAGAGFAVGTPDAWHPTGEAIVATGPTAQGTGLFAVRPNGTGIVPLLPDLPGRVRAPAFSPDGRLVAFTYVDRFVHRMVVADWVGGPSPALANPRILLPMDPRTEGDTVRMRQGLAYHETRGFTPDGQHLLFSSDRNGGMVNVNLYRLHMGSGAVRQLTREDGFVEGGFIGRGNSILYYSSTRAREPALLTLVTGPELPPFLGFAAVPALHDQIAADFRAPVGNGDVFAASASSGLSARIVARRDVIGRGAHHGRAENDRIVACGMSRDGRFLTAAALSPGGSVVVLFERSRRNVPRAKAGAADARSADGRAAQPRHPRQSDDRAHALRPGERQGHVEAAGQPRERRVRGELQRLLRERPERVQRSDALRARRAHLAAELRGRPRCGRR